MRQRLERLAEAYVDPIRHAGPREICPGNVGVHRVRFERDDTAAGRDGPREPDGAVAGQRADFQDATGALRAGHQMEQLSVRWRDADRRQLRGHGCR